jgi:hypothetical protein
MQNGSMVFKSSFNYFNRVEHKKLKSSFWVFKKVSLFSKKKVEKKNFRRVEPFMFFLLQYIYGLYW